MTEVIHITVDADGIATLLFDRTDSIMNTMDMKFMAEIEAAIERLATGDAIKGAIFTSGKAVFAAGADLKEMEANLDEMDDTPLAERLRMNASLSKLLRRMETCGKPVACATSRAASFSGSFRPASRNNAAA